MNHHLAATAYSTENYHGFEFKNSTFYKAIFHEMRVNYAMINFTKKYP